MKFVHACAERDGTHAPRPRASVRGLSEWAEDHALAPHRPGRSGGPAGSEGRSRRSGWPAGSRGSEGRQGPEGRHGRSGYPGPRATPATKGIQGLKGDKGDTGDQGLKGDKGDTGDAGADGADGATGWTRVVGAAVGSNETSPKSATAKLRRRRGRRRCGRGRWRVRPDRGLGESASTTPRPAGRRIARRGRLLRPRTTTAMRATGPSRHTPSAWPSPRSQDPQSSDARRPRHLRVAGSS